MKASGIESKMGEGKMVKSVQYKDADEDEMKIPENPFQLPSDDQVFLLRERERKLKQEKRERMKKLSVWEKTVEQTKPKSGLTHRKLDYGDADQKQLMAPPGAKRGVAISASSGISTERRREKENMTDFIAKKREMFLVQMSLDTKREEIRKLEEKAQLKEEALRKSELMLEEDAIRFDTFLKENDKKAHEAIKRAEMETKLKQDKVQEIKKLNHQIQAVQSDMSKLKEQLEDCEKYKRFLDELTPSEWFEEQLRNRKLRKARKRRAYKAKIMREYEEEKKRLISEHEELRRKEDARLAGKSRAMRKEHASNLPPLRLPDPPVFDFPDDDELERLLEEEEDRLRRERRRARGLNEDDEDDEEDDEEGNSEGKESKYDSDNEEKLRDEEDDLDDEEGQGTPEEEELPMYFNDPLQLLNIFTQLEESNLFLIQNSQETEQALEELKQEFRETKHKMDIKTDSLKANIDELRGQIDGEESKASLLKSRMDSNMGEDSQEKLLRELNEKVKEVYKKCGFDCDASPSTLSMLTDLEARLEDLLGQIENMPEEYVIKAEKLKEKERRERVRAERMAQQQQIYEERLRKSIERSMQAPKKKTGKPVMFRSAPPQKKERKKDNSAAEEKAQDMKEFFSW